MGKKRMTASFIAGLIDNDYTRKWARKLAPKIREWNEKLAK